MKCEKCQKAKATIHLTEIVEDQKHEAHLCEECARQSGVGIKLTFSVQDILGNLVEGKSEREAKTPASDVSCPRCGMTFSEFRSKARMGCADDYDVFQNGVLPLIEKVHGATRHVGKVPKTVGERVQRENELVRLKRELDQLVRSEQFEEAARVRDRIREIETGEAGS